MPLPASATSGVEPLRPFLKWAGGKRSLLREILRLVPARMETYFEPFVGAGALFFALAAEGRFRRAVLADVNAELVDCYLALQSSVEDVIGVLQGMPYESDAYYEIRGWELGSLDRVTRAARTIYLNRAGFNGLYRVNSKGLFNVPFGRHKNPEICNAVRLRAAARALRDVEVQVNDFEATVGDASPNDFIYLDPPYVPVSTTANFTAYASSPFGPSEQARLAKLLRSLGAAEIPAVLSNSDCRETRRLYKGLPRGKVPVRRAINSVATLRGPVSELLVRSFRFSPKRP